MPSLDHATPAVRRAEQRSCMFERLSDARVEPACIGIAAERAGRQPARVVVGGADADPAVAGLEDDERLARQRLRHLLRAVVRLGPKRRRVANERMFA